MTRWQYTVTTREGTADLVEHMQQMDSNGWELLNGSTVCGIGGIAYTMWWRKQGPAPYKAPLPYDMDPNPPARPASFPYDTDPNPPARPAGL